MQGLTLAALAACALLAGCASGGGEATKKSEYLDASYTPVGTLIPQKKGPSRTDNVSIVDKQALENDRNMGSASINLPEKH
jgi:hypothetical protein